MISPYYDNPIDMRLDAIPARLIEMAVDCIERFEAEFPDRRGIRNGCVYASPEVAMYVYRTTGGRFVCRMAHTGQQEEK